MQGMCNSGHQVVCPSAHQAQPGYEEVGAESLVRVEGFGESVIAPFGEELDALAQRYVQLQDRRIERRWPGTRGFEERSADAQLGRVLTRNGPSDVHNEGAGVGVPPELANPGG